MVWGSGFSGVAFFFANNFNKKIIFYDCRTLKTFRSRSRTPPCTCHGGSGQKTQYACCGCTWECGSDTDLLLVCQKIG